MASLGHAMPATVLGPQAGRSRPILELTSRRASPAPVLLQRSPQGSAREARGSQPTLVMQDPRNRQAGRVIHRPKHCSKPAPCEPGLHFPGSAVIRRPTALNQASCHSFGKSCLWGGSSLGVAKRFDPSRFVAWPPVVTPAAAPPRGRTDLTIDSAGSQGGWSGPGGIRVGSFSTAFQGIETDHVTGLLRLVSPHRRNGVEVMQPVQPSAQHRRPGQVARAPRPAAVAGNRASALADVPPVRQHTSPLRTVNSPIPWSVTCCVRLLPSSGC